MRFSFNWLKRHLDTQSSIHDIAQKLINIGLEVEEVVDSEAIFSKYRLVKITEVGQHPNADRLHICTAIDGTGKEYHIVCGATNVREGMKAVLAMEGAYVPGSDITLKRSKIRGVVSEGMLCSYAEVSLPEQNDGIIDLDQAVDLNEHVSTVLGFDGGILDVAITPNRGDCMSVRGIARDLAAAGVGKLLDISHTDCKPTCDFPLDISLDNIESFLNYMPMLALRVVKNVKNGESPVWLKNALSIAGINSVSLLVDLANWYMIDTGRPLHIYDLDKINGAFGIRYASRGEKFIDLKGKQHELRSDMLISADSKSPLCVLGVIGGDGIACSDDTTNILIESAYFNPSAISKTGNFLNIVSDARARFERGIDKESCISGLDGITSLIQEYCSGDASEIFTLGSSPSDSNVITLHYDKLISISNCPIEWADAICILKGLGLTVCKESDKSVTFRIPSWRSDLLIEEDLIEEVLRIYGLDKVPDIPLKMNYSAHGRGEHKEKLQINLKRLLVSRGLSEIVSYPFIKKDWADAVRENRKLIYVVNPINSDMNTMRPSLIPSLLSASLRSLNFGDSCATIFECGHVFYDDAVQQTHVSGIRVGNALERHWLNKVREWDVFDVKGDLEAMLHYCGVEKMRVEASAPSYYHPSRSGTFICGRKTLGYFGELHPRINQLFSINQRIMCFELIAEEVLSFEKKQMAFHSKIFPSITRDFSFLFAETASIGDIVNGIYSLDSIVSNVIVFDCFNIGEGKKSIGISVIFNALDRTLNEDEANNLSAKIVQYVASCGGELRSK